MRNRLNHILNENNANHNSEPISHLVGIGLDNKDGHKRLTRAEKFSVVGGSEETHERMTITFIKTFEDLQKKGKALEQTEPQELSDIIRNNAGRL